MISRYVNMWGLIFILVPLLPAESHSLALAPAFAAWGADMFLCVCATAATRPLKGSAYLISCLGQASEGCPQTRFPADETDLGGILTKLPRERGGTVAKATNAEQCLAQ